jgi:hypothetical protein
MLAEALALSAAIAVAAAPGAAAISVEVSPASLVLGEGQRARVVVRSSLGPPRLSASSGTLGPLAETAPGTYEADLAPPPEAYPQLAIVAALAQDQLAFAALPLVGRGVAVATTAPHARISVRIRERAFGPVQADASGVALVPVVVPPGERYAWHRGRPLDLRVPPLRQLHLVLARGEVRADGEETVAVYAIAARPDGAPWEGAALDLAASDGALGPLREISPGGYVAAWTLPAGAPGEATVEAHAAGVPSAGASVRRVPGPPGRVALRLGSTAVAAGDPAVEVEAEITDAAGNRVDAEVRLAATFGAVSAPSRAGPGVVRARYLVPERLEGRREAAVEAAVGEVVDRRTLALSPAAPAALAVAVEPAELVADGAASAEVRVAVTDRFGNASDGPAPALDARHGRLGPLEPEAPGSYRTRYTAARARADGADAVVARAGALERSAPIRLLAPPRRLAATVRAGLLHALGGFTAPSLAGALELWPSRLGGAWGAAAGLAFARSDRREGVRIGAGTHALASSSELWPATVTLLGRRPLGGRVTGLGGVGAGVVAIRSAVSLDGAAAAAEWGRALAVHATAGAAYELPAWHARVRLEAALAWQEDPGMRSFRGDLTTFGLSLGVSHDAL